ncbi:MAG: glycerophosphodiester phosphodiesterase family protein [Bacteroidota bacterium]
MRIKLRYIFFLVYSPIVFFAQSPTIWQALESKENKILVAAHRGDWKNFPENSIPGIQSCIDHGVDIVEVDVQRTKDGHYVLMHDETVRRTTNGKGRVSKYLFKDVVKLKLKDRKKNLTEFTVPSLDTVLKLIKGRIIVNLDKSSGRFEELLEIIKKYDCGPYVILKGGGDADFFRHWMETDKSGTLFMPVKNGRKNNIDTFVTESGVRLMEVLIRTDTDYVCKNEVMQILKEKKCDLWFNALFDAISGKHTEGKDAIGSWDWFVKNGAKIIQTDYPFHLIQYLAEKNLHIIPNGLKKVDLSDLPRKDTTKIIFPEDDNGESKKLKMEAEIETQRLSKSVKAKKNKSIAKGKKYHLVNSGETLTKIAGDYGTTVLILKELNPSLKKKKTLKSGIKIRVQ